MIVCNYPLKLDTSDDMVMLNDYCYDRDGFVKLRQMFIDKHNKNIRDGYRNPRRIFKDLRTNIDFNFDSKTLNDRHCDSIINPQRKKEIIRSVPFLRKVNIDNFPLSCTRRHVIVSIGNLCKNAAIC